jgi:dTDP-D-glucose 4,6-dehydratase
MPDGQPRRCLDVSAMKEQLQFFPEITLGEGLKNTIIWYDHQFTEKPVPGINKCEKSLETYNVL